MMYRCKICSEHYLSTEALQDHQFASHTQEALEAFGIKKQTVKVSQDWQTRSNESKTEILHSLGYTPSDIQTLISLEFYQFGSKIKKEIGEALTKSTPITQKVQAVESDENKTYQNMYDSYLQARSAQIKKPFQDGTEAKASEDDESDHANIEQMIIDVNDMFGTFDQPLITLREFLTDKGYDQTTINKWITEMRYMGFKFSGEAKASELKLPRQMDFKTGGYAGKNDWGGEATLCEICGTKFNTYPEFLDHYQSHDEAQGEDFYNESKASENDQVELKKLLDATLEKIKFTTDYGERQSLQALYYATKEMLDGYESKASERDPSSYSDGYLQAGRRKLLKKAKEDGVCPVCAEKWDGSEDFWETHFVNKHRLNESKANETLKEDILNFIKIQGEMPAYSSMLRGLGIDIEESEVTRIIQELKAEGRIDTGFQNRTSQNYPEERSPWVKGGGHNYDSGEWTWKNNESKASEDWESQQRGLSDSEEEELMEFVLDEWQTRHVPYMSVGQDVSYNAFSSFAKSKNLTQSEIDYLWNNGANASESKASESVSKTQLNILEKISDGEINFMYFTPNNTLGMSGNDIEELIFLGLLDNSDSPNDSYNQIRVTPEGQRMVIDYIKESKASEALKSHTDYHKLINSTLSGETSIQCSKCTKKFKAQESLDIHYNDSHADNELKSLVGELNSGEGHWVNSNPFDLTSDAEYVEDEDYEVTPAPKPEPEQKEEGEAMVEDIVHKTESGVDITHPQDEWCELCEKPTTSFEVSDDEYDEEVEDLMEEEGVDEITDFDEEEKKDFFEDVDDIKVTDEEAEESEELEDARKYMQSSVDWLDQTQAEGNPEDEEEGSNWQKGGEMSEEEELQQARESLAPLNKLDDEKSNVTKAFESGASAEDIYSKVGDTTQDRGSEDDLTDIYNQVDVKLNLEKV